MMPQASPRDTAATGVKDAKSLVGPAVIVALGLPGIFLLPWYVPRGGPLYSASYEHGFNNLVATLALAALVAALFILALRKAPGAGSLREPMLRDLLRAPASRGNTPGLTAAFGAVTILTLAILFTWYRIMPRIYFGEFGFDVSRLELMILGKRPYRDFLFNYGPAMLYPAYWIYRLGDRLSIEAAYCITLLAQWTAGLSLLFYTVRSLCRGARAVVVFLCSSLAVFNMTMGLGYTPLRFLLPIASLLFLHRRLETWAGQGRRGLVKAGGGALLLPLGGLAISPEIGLSLVCGTTALFAGLFFTPLRRLAAVAPAPACSVGITLLACSRSYLDGILSVGSGANNFPVFPTPHILLFVAACCLVLPQLGVIASRERNGDGALALALVVSLGMLLPAVFGRSDPQHVLFNGLGILVLFLALVVALPNGKLAALALGCFVVTFPLLNGLVIVTDPQFPGTWNFRTAILVQKNVAQRNLDPVALDRTRKFRFGKLPMLRHDLLELRKYGAIGTPFYPGEEIDRFLKLTGQFVPEYYSGLNQQVYTPTEIGRKIAGLANMNILLVQKDPMRYPIYLSESSPSFLSKLLFFPERFIPKPKRPEYVPGWLIVAAIMKDFSVIGEFRDFSIMQRTR